MIFRVRHYESKLMMHTSKGATIALIIEPEEIDRGQITVKHMKDGSESKQKINELTQIVSEILLQQ